MAGFHRVRDRLSYANVTATLALFIALGGASYAAIELPAHSVGDRQLRRGAVTPEALGFQFGARVFSPPSPFFLPPSPTCSDRPPGLPTCFVARKENLLLGHLHVHAPAQIALTALLTVENSHAPEQVRIELFESARSVASTSVEVGAAESTVHVPLQALSFVKAGTYSIGLGAWADYPDGISETVALRGGSVIATTFPQASAPTASECTSAQPLLC